MLISSKFKDYYDKALGLSYSKDDIRYIRETKEVELKEIPEGYKDVMIE